jgi:hypothetical protein
MKGGVEVRQRGLQFGLVASTVALICYLVLMINGLGIGLNRQAGSQVDDIAGVILCPRASLTLLHTSVTEQAPPADDSLARSEDQV